MPIIPEKNNARRGSRSALHSQFWESKEHSSRYIDGIAWKLPCEPSSMILNASSGVSRSQQLIAAHSIGIPVVPSYDQHSGGLVLDRSVAKVGGASWWSVLNCRVKAQQMYTETLTSASRLDALKNLKNYALCSRTKVKAGPWMTFDNVVEVSDLSGMPSLGNMIRHGATHSSVRIQVHGHSICGRYSTNMDTVECSGDYARVPQAASIDFSTHNRQDGLQYRVGMYQVSAPSLEGAQEYSMRTALHAQGAVAVEGEAYVWKGKSSRKEQQQQRQSGVSVTSTSGALENNTSVTTLSDVAPTPVEDDTGDVEEKEQVVQDEEMSGSEGNRATDVLHAEANISNDIYGYVKGLDEPVGTSVSVTDDQTTPRLLPVTSESISNLISESFVALEDIRKNVLRITDEVQEGSLQKFASGARNRKSRRVRPYSFLLSQPHVKLAASLGCLVRMPLPNKFGILGGDDLSESENVQFLPTLRRNQNASTTSLVSKTSLSSQLAEAWEPYLKKTALRVFSSIGIGAQIGSFTKPLLDYSSLDLKLDFGLNSQHVVGNLPITGAPSAIDVGTRPDKHRAFALEGKGIWHCCSLSVSQQIFGPVRGRADFRFALDPTNTPQNQGERSTLKGIAQTAMSMRPCLLESMFGGDVLLPGTEGAARLAIWYAPKRKEGMIELRLF
ncbi:hypothetical protein M9435_000248 [Picochlorum sp. BPE23]|nr:hypothetical protein M9435_000248 [Picochlorum sp. BPE23]